ncbi:deuterolysin M35 metalloprotease [Cylindrobasidium torrendii FP15055 ss-10]|uniref:Deuterolysin M35 metalloprotease n=1 Tax=Cylindrobasidium torrendii FP15055 ss-10 TaxID=1314674 RepID=A0A0D7BLF4_9AGAR|nr:deuterolysin M35 metalloprotease [Cylindrobasidium torrendii FP15055 ss-10]
MFARTSLLALAFTAISATAAPSLSLAVTGADSVVDVTNLEISATLTNTGDESVKILNDPNSVINAFPANSFSIDSESGSPAFIGAHVKYSAEAAAADGAYTELAPGESVSVSHNLAASYNFTLPGETSYNFKPSPFFQVVSDSGEISTVEASVPEVHTAKLAGTLAVARNAPSKRISYNGCTSSRQSTVATAASAANTYASNAVSYLQGISASTERYAYWFGAYTASRKSTVQSHYTAIAGYDFTEDYTYDCTCTESGTYAYVYPAQFGTIYLCPVFWSTTTTGTDSRAGTLIHESSHFTATAGTDDHVYGQSSAHSLALSNPTNAIDNADNHEYFAENTPSKA